MPLQPGPSGFFRIDDGPPCPRPIRRPERRRDLRELRGARRTRLSSSSHEIGHAHVHTSSLFGTAADVDPSRTTEAAPVGLLRVEDYGARERRELQANVFAREFLFPRALARRLHMDDGLGVAEISRRERGSPNTFIRQQIFDSLLLPPATRAGGKSHTPIPLRS